MKVAVCGAGAAGGGGGQILLAGSRCGGCGLRGRGLLPQVRRPGRRFFAGHEPFYRRHQRLKIAGGWGFLRQEISQQLRPARKPHLPGGEAQRLKGLRENAKIQRLAGLDFVQGRACIVQTVRRHSGEDLQVARILGEGCLRHRLEHDCLGLGRGRERGGRSPRCTARHCSICRVYPVDQGLRSLRGGVGAPRERLVHHLS